MVQKRHKTCTEWGQTRFFQPGGGFDAYYTPQRLDDFAAGSDFTHVPCPHVRCEACDAPALHADAIVIAVDGACKKRADGSAKLPRAAAATYFTQTSRHNAVYMLEGGIPDHPEPTSQRAELTAGIKALEKAAELFLAGEKAAAAAAANAAAGAAGRDDGDSSGTDDCEGAGAGGRRGDEGGGGGGGIDGPLSQVVVKTDSQYLVQAAAEWLPKWKGNGWMNSRGRVISNVDLFWYLDKRITWLEWIGVEVLFWHVPREQNQEARRMAKRALEGAAWAKKGVV